MAQAPASTESQMTPRLQRKIAEARARWTQLRAEGRDPAAELDAFVREHFSPDFFRRNDGAPLSTIGTPLLDEEDDDPDGR